MLILVFCFEKSVGFSGTPIIMGPLCSPYYSHTTSMFESLKIWVPWYGSRLRGSHVLGGPWDAPRPQVLSIDPTSQPPTTCLGGSVFMVGNRKRTGNCKMKSSPNFLQHCSSSTCLNFSQECLFLRHT